MGRRYGRNQKRQHRERIAALEKAHEMDRGLLSYFRKKADELEGELKAWDEEVRRLLGEHSALRRQTPEIQSQHPIREMPIRQPVSFRYDAEAALSMSTLTETRERMRRFVFAIDKSDMQMQRLMRFMETDGRGGVAYAISETALKQGFGKREIAYMAHEIATRMADHWNTKK